MPAVPPNPRLAHPRSCTAWHARQHHKVRQLPRCHCAQLALQPCYRCACLRVRRKCLRYREFLLRRPGCVAAPCCPPVHCRIEDACRGEGSTSRHHR